MPSDRLAFASFAVETFLYGLYLAVALLSLFLLYRRSRETKPFAGASATSIPLLVGPWALIVCVTAHWTCGFVRIFTAFFLQNEGQAPGNYLASELPLHAAQKVFLLATIMLWDLTMTYRLYIIFHRQRSVLVFPAVVIVGFVGAKSSWRALGCKRLCLVLEHEHLQHWSDKTPRAMITWRILRQSRFSFRSGGPSVSVSLAIFIESAAIGILHGFFFVATYLAQHPAHNFAVDSGPPVYGLALALINLRVALGIPSQASSRSDLDNLSGLASGVVFAPASTDMHVHSVALALGRAGESADLEDSRVDVNMSSSVTK
ncbi:hypothetical protein GGG16DRAFT_126879 [Schizophyllum commune]|nr:hypothetical protein K525DRAFT_291144 [Schizophyllum commune Loenen D]